MATFTHEGLSPVVVETDVGDFRLTARAAREGDAFDAVDAAGTQVALVLVDREVAEAPGFARRFRRLARARARVSHPNLLDVRGWGKSPQGLYLVMAFSGAPTLAQELRSASLDATTSVHLLWGVAEGLRAAHSVGLVARALAPEDIRVEAGRPLLADLGISKPQHQCLSLMISDSVYYASPEELRDEPLVPQSNVYSLACILCECLTGRPPYPYGRRVTVPYAHLTEAPPPLTERRPDLPADIDEVIARAMAAEAWDRYPSPTALIEAAGSALGTSIAPSRRRPAALRPNPATRRPRLSRRAALGLAGGLCVMTAGLVGYSVGTREQAPVRQANNPPAIAAEVQRLKASRLDERSRLSTAKRPSAQAAIADELAAIYAGGRAVLDRSGAPPALLRAMAKSRRAYAELSAAARRGERRAYRSAALAVRDAERELDAALRSRAAG